MFTLILWIAAALFLISLLVPQAKADSVIATITTGTDPLYDIPQKNTKCSAMAASITNVHGAGNVTATIQQASTCLVCSQDNIPNPTGSNIPCVGGNSCMDISARTLK